MQLSICKYADLKIQENQDQYENPFSCSSWYSIRKFADLKKHENHDQNKNPSAALNTVLNGRIC